MKVVAIGNEYQFTYESMADVVAYNEWVDEIGIEGATVAIPMGVSPRNLRRITTKSPTILKCLDGDATERLRERWQLRT